MATEVQFKINHSMKLNTMDRVGIEQSLMINHIKNLIFILVRLLPIQSKTIQFGNIRFKSNENDEVLAAD